MRTDSRLLALTLFPFAHLLRQVVLVGHLLDHVELSFEPIDVVLFIKQDFLQQLARAVVAGRNAGLDADAYAAVEAESVARMKARFEAAKEGGA